MDILNSKKLFLSVTHFIGILAVMQVTYAQPTNFSEFKLPALTNFIQVYQLQIV